MKKQITWLIHITYWGLYITLVYFVFMLMKSFNKPSFTQALFSPQLFLTIVLPPLICFYSFYGILFSRFLKKKQFVQLVLFSLLISLGSSLLSFGLTRLTGPAYVFSNREAAVAGTLFISFLGLLHGIIALVIKGFVSWYGDIKIKEELDQRARDMQLELIKLQIQPHFLFNTLNNIDVLIRKDSEKASLYLNRLSDIMRFFLYQTSAGPIPFLKELDYIEKYISLQQIRYANPDYVRFAVQGSHRSFNIEPMVFIPFIENAFKHAAPAKEGEAIDISFSLEAHAVLFHCENDYRPASGFSGDKGLGNELIIRRLNLLYGKQHAIRINDTGTRYTVDLKIEHAG